jgi:hypothetical protein
LATSSSATFGQVIDQSDPSLLSKAEFITIVFASQKNSDKMMDARTQWQTSDHILCPILH